MQYQTTRNSEKQYTFEEMVRESVPVDGGLFVPSNLPELNPNLISDLKELNFSDRATYMLKKFAPELSHEQANRICQKAFNPLNYENELIYEAKTLNPYLNNPIFVFADNGVSGSYTDLTHAFSIACLEEFMKSEEQWFIIAGESVQSIKSLVAHHKEESNWQPLLITDGKSVNNFLLKEIQYLWHISRNLFEQVLDDSDESVILTIDEDSPAFKNLKDPDLLTVYTINGRVQDCEYFSQSLFYNQELRQKLSEQNKYIASVGSVNFCQQLVLYILLVSSIIDLLSQELIEPSGKIALAFPNINLDFVYTAQLLQKSGLTISGLYAASNSNRSVAEFFRTGKYKLKRRFFRTNTPALDQVYYPNVERILYDVSGNDCSAVTEIMDSFVVKEQLEIPRTMASKLANLLRTGYSNNKQTIFQMKEWYLKTDYLFDPYTALTLDVLERLGNLPTASEKILIPVIENPLLSAQTSAEAILDSKRSKKRNYVQLLQEIVDESGVSVTMAAVAGPFVPHTVNLGIEDVTEQITEDLLSF